MTSTLVLVVAIVASVAVATNNSPHHYNNKMVWLADYTTLFREWASEQGKSYDTEEEFLYRLKVFTDNLHYIEEHNADTSFSYKLGLTAFADLTHEEFSRLYLAPAWNVTPVAVENGPTTIQNIDWRSEGAVTPVKNQGTCGSCYTFSSTGGLEGCHQIASGTLLSLSEQQILDCSATYGNKGCDGGNQYNSYTYLKKIGGIELESDYPYTGVVGTCKATSSLFTKATVEGYTEVTATESALQTAIVGRPVPVSIDASHIDFQLYSSGVYCPSTCSSTTLDHAVLAVGMSTSSGGYYIVKNSWGTSWGISGYFYLCANQDNKCGIATSAVYPKCS